MNLKQCLKIKKELETEREQARLTKNLIEYHNCDSALKTLRVIERNIRNNEQ